MFLFALLNPFELGANRIRIFHEGPGLLLGLEALAEEKGKAGKKAWNFHGQDLSSPGYLGDFSIR